MFYRVCYIMFLSYLGLKNIDFNTPTAFTLLTFLTISSTVMTKW